jgi:hypothetical protein
MLTSLLALLMALAAGPARAENRAPAVLPPDPHEGEPVAGRVVGEPLHPSFRWPDVLTPETLRGSVVEYATRVGVCATIDPHKMDAGQKSFFDTRPLICRSIAREADTLRANTKLGALERKDKYCDAVRRTYVTRTFSGGACPQYGNCGEAAMVNYCLAHLAGVSAVKICQSAWDHVFAVARMPGGELCVMDRWHLRGTGGDDDYYFCAKGIEVKDGVLQVPSAKDPTKLEPSSRRWYQKLSCYDPLQPQQGPLAKLPPVRQTNLSLATWDEMRNPKLATARVEEDKVRVWREECDKDVETRLKLAKEAREDEAKLNAQRPKLPGK